MIFDKMFQTAGRSSMTVGELLTILAHIQQLCAAAGAKTAAKDLQAFSDALKDYSDRSVDKACAEIKQSVAQAAERPAKPTKKSSKSSASLNQDLIQHHLGELRAAGTNQRGF